MLFWEVSTANLTFWETVFDVQTFLNGCVGAQSDTAELNCLVSISLILQCLIGSQCNVGNDGHIVC